MKKLLSKELLGFMGYIIGFYENRGYLYGIFENGGNDNEIRKFSNELKSNI